MILHLSVVEFAYETEMVKTVIFKNAFNLL